MALLPLLALVVLFTLSNASTFPHPSSVDCPCTIHLHRHVTHPNTPVSLFIRREHSTSLHPSSLHNITLRRSTNPYLHTHSVTIPDESTLHLTLHASQVQLRVRSFRASSSPACPVKVRRGPPVAHAVIRQRPTPRIVGGNFAAPNLIPYMVAIYNPDGRYCTGTLIAPQWGVTAAHCLMDATFTVSLMTTQAFVDGEERQIVKVINHKGYGSTGLPRQNDIAAFKLNESVEGVRFATVNADSRRPGVGEFVRIVGFGHISYREVLLDSGRGRLRQVDIPVVEYDVCKKVYEIWETVSKRKQVCAGYFGRGGCDACSGDSGGPMFQYDAQGNPVIVGLVSYGVECGRPDYPGVYVRLSAFQKWLRSNRVPFQRAKWSASKPSKSKPTSKPPTVSRTPTPTPSPASAASISKPPRRATPTPASGVRCARGEKARGNRCVKCHKMASSAGGAGAKCTRCPNGQYRHPMYGHRCACVGPNAVGRGMIGEVCKLCPPGTFSGVTYNRCVSCRAGTFSNRYGSVECKRCPRGTRSVKGSSRCSR